MECERTRELLEEYAAGRNAPEEAAAVADHLKACPDCGRELRWIRALKAAVQAQPRPALPADLRADLLRLARARRPGWRERCEAFWSWRSAAGLGLASAFAAAAGLLVFRDPFSRGAEELSLDEALAAHGRYELTMPAADREAIYADLGLRLSDGDRP